MKKLLATIQGLWKDLHTKEHRNGKNALTRYVLFFMFFLFFDATHEWYTQSRFGYALRTSDGFIGYLPYIFFLAFLCIRFKKIISVPKLTPKIVHFFLFFLSALFFFSLPAKFNFVHSETLTILIQLCFLSIGYVSLFFSTMGIGFVQYFFVDLSLLILLLIPSRLAPILIDTFWQYSSHVTMFGLSLLLPLFRLDYSIVPHEYLVRVKDFTVIIGPPCAGIHSLTAFTILFGAILLLVREKRKMKKGATLFYYLFGLICVFFLNSLRVLLIILVGVYYSKEFAVNLFHKSIGSLLLLLFFTAYTSFIMPKIILSQSKQKEKNDK